MKKNRLSILLVLVCVYHGYAQNSLHERDKAAATDLRDGTIINLYDAFGEDDPALTKDFGFSCVLKYNGTTILFDAGSNADIFKRNVQALGIDLREIDFAIASHAHFDHINGFDYLLEINPDVTIYFPRDLFWGANLPFNLKGREASIADSLESRMQYFGGNFHAYMFNQSGRFWQANVEFISEHTKLAPGITVIATTSPYMGYFTRYPTLGLDADQMSTQRDGGDATFMELPELSLSLETATGEVLIVGCSHSTVERIVAETRSHLGHDIALVYGGYHLLPYDREVLTDLAVRLKEDLKVAKVAPAHCTGHLAFKILQDHFGTDYIFAGLGERIRF